MTFYHNSNLKKHIETTHAASKAMSALPVYPQSPLDGLMMDQGSGYTLPAYSPYDGYSYAQYNHYHQHNHYYQNNVYYGRQWWTPPNPHEFAHL